MLRLRRIVLSLIAIFGPTLASAQETSRVTAAPLLNAFYGEYEVIPDHPSCSGDDRIAFRINADLTNVIHYARIRETGEVLQISPSEQFTDTVCYRRERRGLNVLRLQVRCTDARIAEARERAAQFPVKLDVAAKVDVCTSPTGHENLGGTWSATMRDGDFEQTQSGLFDTGDGVRTDQNQARGRIQFVPRGQTARLLQVQRPENMIGRQLVDTTAIALQLACLSFRFAEDQAGFSDIATTSHVFLFDTAPEPCIGQNCPIVVSRRYSEMGPRNCGR